MTRSTRNGSAPPSRPAGGKATQEVNGSTPSSSSRNTPAKATGTPPRSTMRPSWRTSNPGSRHTNRTISFQSAVTRLWSAISCSRRSSTTAATSVGDAARSRYSGRTTPRRPSSAPPASSRPVSSREASSWAADFLAAGLREGAGSSASFLAAATDALSASIRSTTFAVGSGATTSISCPLSLASTIWSRASRYSSEYSSGFHSRRATRSVAWPSPVPGHGSSR